MTVTAGHWHALAVRHGHGGHGAAAGRGPAPAGGRNPSPSRPGGASDGHHDPIIDSDDRGQLHQQSGECILVFCIFF
jgi:hypothetical protein